MKESNVNTPKKSEKLNIKNLAAYFKNYAQNCRYSFNRMLNA
jgi:hypothetical protein